MISLLEDFKRDQDTQLSHMQRAQVQFHGGSLTVYLASSGELTDFLRLMNTMEIAFQETASRVGNV